jgi:hypothetical protein
MGKLKWRRCKIDLCTPFLKRHVVMGYVHGELGVHKIPDLMPEQWTITHIATGMNVVAGVRIAFTRMKDVKEFATMLLISDSWYIEGAEWGVYGNHERCTNLTKLLMKVLSAFGFRDSPMPYGGERRSAMASMCSCGKIAKRYVSVGGTEKWAHRCLECEPYKKG